MTARALSDIRPVPRRGLSRDEAAMYSASRLENSTPQAEKLPIAPIFKAASVTLAVSRDKDGKLRLVYAGRDERLLCWTSHERASAFRPETVHCRSLISHSRRAVSVSCASGLGDLCSWSEKYTPLTFATSGEVASHTRVSAPFSGLRDTGLRIVIPKSISRPLLRLNPVATSPGWKQFAVTPVPSRRRASSVVNRMLASLVSQ